MRETMRRWQKKLGRLNSADPGAGVLDQWLKQTESHWEGLFHCYSNPRIPNTNNEGERLILLVKNTIRRLANNPNPAVRVMRSGAVTALFVGRNVLPGVEFVAATTPEMRAKAQALLAAQRAKIGVMQRSRRDFDGELKRLVERARKASCGPPRQPTMMDSELPGT